MPVDINQPYLGIYYLSTRTPESKEDSSEGKYTIINVFAEDICSCLVQKMYYTTKHEISF